MIRIAIIHDILLDYGGAERVLEELISIFPQADLYTFFLNENNRVINKNFNTDNVRSSLLTNFSVLGKLGKYLSIFKPLALLYFYFLDLSKYDFVITSSGSYNAKFVRFKGKHLCYLHTPPKYLYEETNQLDWIRREPFKTLLLPLIMLLRFIDKKSGDFPDVLVCNSREVQKRVDKYYKRKSQIIYPPVNVRNRVTKNQSGEYYVFHSRLVKNKGLELVINTANKYNLPLIVIGEGHLFESMKKVAGKTIKFLGFVNDNKLASIYSHAKALIYASIDEDFGIVPVEAMGYGIPVVAYESGGVEETVINKKTGIFFNKYTKEALYEALQKSDKYKINCKDCYLQAKNFSAATFRKKILATVSKMMH
jgi:glycosyltransferase involved in cell wall biosynthesis